MTKQEKDEWLKENDMEAHGYEPRPVSAVRLHGRNETVKHLLLKTLVARTLQRRGRKWDTEVKGPNGRVDVLDFGEPDEQPVVYEIQTGATPEGRREKAEKYAVGPVRDVLFLDPEDAPDDAHALQEWVEERVVG